MKEPQQNRFSSGNIASTCECIESRIHESMDLRQALLSVRIVRDHVSQCDRCAELVVDLGALNDSLSQIPLATLHRLSGLQESEIAKLSKRRSKLTHPVLFVATVACLTLVMLTSGMWFSNFSIQPQVAELSLQTEPVHVARVEKVESTLELQHVLLPAARHSVLATQQFGLATAHQTASPTRLLSAVNFQDISGNVEPYQEYIGMTADLPGIRPVSKSVNATYHLIKSLASQSRNSGQLVP